MKLAFTYFHDPEGKPEGYIRSYRIYEDSEEMVAQAFLVSSSGILETSPVTPKPYTAIPPYTIEQERTLSYISYVFTCLQTGVILGYIKDGAILSRTGDNLAMIKDSTSTLKRIVRDMLGGVPQVMDIVAPEQEKVIGSYRRADMNGLMLSQEKWKKAMELSGEKPAGTLTLSGQEEMTLDPRLLWGAGILIHNTWHTGGG